MIFGRRQLRILSLIAVVPLLLGAGLLASLVLPRDALRKTVQLCAAMMSTTNLPVPCSRFESEAGFEVAILDPPVPGKHRLVVPVAPVSGIEDDVLLGEAGAAYFAAAWRTALESADNRWAAAGVAVNSALVRTQDQLHFHTDCQSDYGVSSLQRLQAAPGWRQLGRQWVTSVRSDSEGFNPFALLRHIPELSGRAREVNLGVFGVRAQAPSWVIVVDTDRGSYERFLTTRCHH